MKKLISILLIFLMVASTGGVYYLFEWQKARIERTFKLKLKAGIPEAQWVLFKFADMNDAKTRSELRWVKSYEFIYKGGFYDIVKETTVNDSLYLYCVYDFKDTKLAAKKKRALNESPDDRTKFAPQYRVLFNWFFQTLKSLQPAIFFQIKPIQYYYSALLRDVSFAPDTPPPQVISFFM